VARYGGEEFVLVLAGSDAAGAAGLAEGLRTEVERLAIPHAHAPHGRAHVSISLGVAAARPEIGAPWRGLVARADAALYRAKARGRNRVEVEGETQDGAGPAV